MPWPLALSFDPKAKSFLKSQDDVEFTAQPQNEAKNPWKTCLDHVVKRDKTKCNAWGEDIDNILIFVCILHPWVRVFSD